MPVTALDGLTFGGPNRDILFVVAQEQVIDANTTQQVSATITQGTSLYMITNIGASGQQLSRIRIPGGPACNGYHK